VTSTDIDRGGKPQFKWLLRSVKIQQRRVDWTKFARLEIERKKSKINKVGEIGFIQELEELQHA
jgi:hypothetical protein